MPTPFRLFAVVLLAATVSAQTPEAGPSEPAAVLAESVAWIRASNKIVAQYDYRMSVKIRILVFWISRDDVGGGYIRRLEAPDDPRLKSLEVLFGSDPKKAGGVNRWGAGTEVMRLVEAGKPELASSAFLGFMKASKGDSAAAMQAEIRKEKADKQYLFDVTVTRADPDRAMARTTPFTSHEDYTFRELERASKTVLDGLDKTDRPIIRKDAAGGGCNRAAGFLSTVQELLEAALESRPAPLSLCYSFNARHYTATLKSWKLVDQATTHNPAVTYRRLLRANFTVLNHADGKTSTFEILTPREGSLRGAPVEIIHQPNFWFQIVLDLKQ